MTEYETVIGLECHVELSTATKMFCGCRNAFGAPPNTNVCPVCLGLPGALPVPNAAAIESIVKIGLALNCEIAPDSLFHRKNYFYPDMPKDFQISQYDLPICVGGHLDIEVEGDKRTIGITRVHMEEDTGKTTHVGQTGRIGSADYALVDYNRAGVPLVECVSEPDIRTPEEARAYLTELRATLQSLDVSDVRMEEGSLRCDANISLRSVGEATFGTRVEVKNLNSIRSLERALRFEQDRQRSLLDRGETVTQETRHFDEEKGSTHTLRSKEEAFDYRYFPEPDLTPLAPDAAWVDGLRETLPELPAAKRDRYAKALGLKPEVARVLTTSPTTSAFFEETIALGADTTATANWLTQDVAAVANEARVELEDTKLTPKHLAELISLVKDGTISRTAGKEVLEDVVIGGDAPADVVERKGLKQVSDTSALEAWADEAITENASAVEQYRSGKEGALNAVVIGGDGPADVVERKGLKQVSDTSALEAWADEAITENASAVEQYRSGKEGALNAVVGAVMKRSGGSANAQAVRELLIRRLASD